MTTPRSVFRGRATMSKIELPDTPETRRALQIAHSLSSTRYNDLANCKDCDLTKVEEFKQTADMFHAALTELENKI